MRCFTRLLDGLHTRKIGGYKFGAQLTLRNIGDSEADFTRRYIRFHVSLFGATFLFEFRFRNSI